MEKVQADMFKVQAEIFKGKPVYALTKEEFNYTQKPLGKAIYKHSVGRPRKEPDEKTSPKDKIVCDICGRTFTRSGRTNHKRSQFHKAHEKINRKLKELLID